MAEDHALREPVQRLLLARRRLEREDVLRRSSGVPQEVNLAGSVLPDGAAGDGSHREGLPHAAPYADLRRIQAGSSLTGAETTNNKGGKRMLSIAGKRNISSQVGVS